MHRPIKEIWMASYFSELHTYRVSSRKRLRARTYLHDHIHRTCLALLLSHETCSEDDEMPSKEEVAIVFTIDCIDVLLQNGPIPLSLYLSQPDIDTDLLLCSMKQANQQSKGSFCEEKKCTHTQQQILLHIALHPPPQKWPQNLVQHLDDSYSSPLPPPPLSHPYAKKNRIIHNYLGAYEMQQRKQLNSS